MSVRVLIADDQAVVRTGFRYLMEDEADLEVVGEAEDGEQAVAMALRRRPDVVLMDVRMPRLDGLAATRRLAADSPGTGVLVVTTFDVDEYVFGALRSGAAGFLLKDAPPDVLVAAVREVAAGRGLIAPAVTRRLIARFGQLSPAPERTAILVPLSDREREVLVLVAAGCSNVEIGRALFVEESTVKTHVSSILSKLGLRSRVQAVIAAYESGLVTPGAKRADRRAAGSALAGGPRAVGWPMSP